MHLNRTCTEAEGQDGQDQNEQSNLRFMKTPE